MYRKTLLQTPNYTQSERNFDAQAAIDIANNTWPQLLIAQQLHQSSWFSSPNSWNQVQFVPSVGSMTTLPNLKHPSTTRLMALLKRVDIYNGTTQQQRCQPVRLMAPPKATRVSTENQEFEVLIKALYKKCQLSHHTTIWKEFPKSI